MSYFVEHLATFSTVLPGQQAITPKLALQRLFAMEKTSGIWTQRMAIQVEGSHLLICDRETNDVVEQFPAQSIQQPVAFSHSNHIYDNILMFVVQHPHELDGELHIFQCVSDYAQQIAEDLNNWISKHGHGSNEPISPPVSVPIGSRRPAGPPQTTASGSPIKVKDAVNVFNAIAAQREKKSSVSPGPTRRVPMEEHADNSSVTTIGSGNSGRLSGKNSGSESISSGDRDNEIRRRTHPNEPMPGHRMTLPEHSPLAIEKYVTILNHCFDEIERFSLRLQHAAVAYKELQLRNFKQKGANGNEALIAMRARGPSEEDYFEILSKFKLAFNLLAKLKGHIHDPNAPELVHFLFTPLAIIIEAARNNPNVPIDATAVEMPFLHHEAIDLLSNCCTSKEFDLWQSLGPNWTQVRHVIHTPKMPIFQPVFSDGWAPVITEPELIGFTPTAEQQSLAMAASEANSQRPIDSRSRSDLSRSHDNGRLHSYLNEDAHESTHRLSSPSRHKSYSKEEVIPFESVEMEQQHYLFDLHQRNAKVVRVLYPRTANNEKELTVFRGEILEIVDNSRQWWKAINSKGQVAHVPNTIVKELDPNELASINLNNSNSSASRNPDSRDWVRMERQGKKGEFRYF